MGCQQSLRPNLIHGTVTVIVVTVTDMDTGEERDPLMPNQKLMPHLKLMPKLSHGTDMVDTTATDTHTDMAATDIATWERDLLMPNQKQKLHHGTDMVDTMVDTTDTHTLMVDTTDIPTAITTLERDLLMLNQKLKLSHGTVTVDTMATATHTDMDMDTDTGVKSFLQCYQEHIVPQLKYLPLLLATQNTFQKLFKVWKINEN